MLQFGKHRGRTWAEILERDWRYVMWFHENVKRYHVPKHILEQATEAQDEYDEMFYNLGDEFWKE